MGVIRTAAYLLCFCLVACTWRGTEPVAPVLGREPVDRALVLEQRAAAIAHWAEQGVKGAVLINASPIDSLGYVSPDVIDHLRRLIKAREWARAEEFCRMNLGPANYLTAAVKLGIVSEIHWVLPFRLFDDIVMAEGRIKAFLNEASTLPSEVISGMSMQDGSLTGPVVGGTLFVSSPRTLRKPATPVLLNVDAGFFPVSYHEYGITKLASLRNLFEELAFRELKVRAVTVASSVPEGVVSPEYGYLTAEIVEGLKTPQWFRAEAPPDLWKARDAVDDALSGGEAGLAAASAEAALKKHQGDQPLRMLRAAALAGAGETARARGEIEALCGEDRSNCYGFVSMGDRLFGELKIAGEFFRLGVDQLPNSPLAVEKYARFQLAAGNYQAAAELADRLVRLRRGADDLLLQGDCYRAAGKKVDAVKAYEKGIALLGDGSRIKVTQRQMRSLGNLSKSYAESGELAKSESISSRYYVNGDER
ncbi:MAG: hypothetical protein HYS23_14625 [Geobacter sp.]|nr:hypothetical protein [Geobacter sp.]